MLIYLLIAVFVGFIFSIISMTTMPGVTIKVLEIFKFFKKGALTVSKSTRNMGAGSNQGKNITYYAQRKSCKRKSRSFNSIGLLFHFRRHFSVVVFGVGE